MMLYVPDSANMRITLKDLDIQPSFPKMNGSSHATDTRANDADGLDVEALISHCSGHFLVSCILYRCNRESSNKRKRKLSRRAPKKTNANKDTAMQTGYQVNGNGQFMQL